MKLKTKLANYEHLSLKDFCIRVGLEDAIFPCMDDIREYYNDKLPLWRILNCYGVDDVIEGDESQQVPCILESHGSGDLHASARYYSYNRETLELDESYYCFKCESRLTSFDLIFRMEKDRNELKFTDLFDFIRSKFKVDFPYHIILEFDPKEYFVLEGEEATTKSRKAISNFKMAEDIRSLKQKDLPAYVSSLVEYYSGL